MADFSLQDIKALFETYEANREVRHVELRNDLHRLSDKVEKKNNVIEKRLVILETKAKISETFKTWWKPISISLITALIVGGFGYYVS